MVESLNKINREERASILIFHLYIEYFVDWFIRKKIDNPDKIIQWPFSRKLELVESFKILPANTLKNVKHLDSIRNLYAHNIDTDSEHIQKQFREYLKLFDYYAKHPRLYEKWTNFDLYSYFATMLYHDLHFAYAKFYGIEPTKD